MFGILRLSFSRQTDFLSGIPDTVLGVRPTDGLFVWCSAFFAFRSVDKSAFSRVFRIPSWAFARQIGVLSGVLRFSVFVQSTDRHSLGCSGYRPGRSPDKRAFCRLFGILRLSFCRQIGTLSGDPGTVLSVRPTDRRSVWCFAVFGIRSVDRSAFCLVFGLLSWAFARQKSVLSGFLRFSVSVQSTDWHFLGCSGYPPRRSPDRWAFCLVFGILRLSFSRQIGILSGVPDTVLGVRPTDRRSVWCFAVFGIRSVDRSAFSRVFRIPSWAFARQKSVLSAVRHSSPFVLPTDWHPLR